MWPKMISQGYKQRIEASILSVIALLFAMPHCMDNQYLEAWIVINKQCFNEKGFQGSGEMTVELDGKTYVIFFEAGDY